MTKKDYIKAIEKFIAREGIDTTNDLDYNAEIITDTIATLYPVDTDADRDSLTAAAYEVLKRG